MRNRLGLRPWTVERHSAAVPNPTLQDALCVAWHGEAASRRAMCRDWPTRHAGTPRPGLLFSATEAHHALRPLLLLGAVPLVIQKGLHSLGASHTIGWT